MRNRLVRSNLPNSRGRVSRRRDRKVFSRTADSVHYINTSAVPMRGGIRL